MMSKADSPKRICLIFTQGNRADRERLSGVLRFAADKRNWDVRMLDRSSPTFRSDANGLSRAWCPDGIIYTADAGSEEALALVAAPTAVLIALDPPENTTPAHASVIVAAAPDEIAAHVSKLLLRRGFADFGFYGTEAPDERDYSISTERHFIMALKMEKRLCATYRETADKSWSDRLKSAAEWVQSLPKPCGVLAYSDDLARNLLNACRLAGTKVPEQIAIIGVDDSAEVCESCRPTITSVRLDFEQSGYLAAQALQRRLLHPSKGNVIRIRYGVSGITERATTQDLRGCGRIVSAAGELIRTLPLDTLTVGTVAARLNISRRLLEMHFKTVVGRTVRDEITTRRLTAIRMRLLKGIESISSIALDCGYRSLNAAQIAYRKRFGHAMSEERR